jgi:hypothetical protein
MEEKILFFLELAAGIIGGFAVWSLISPSLSSVNPTPNA